MTAIERNPMKYLTILIAFFFLTGDVYAAAPSLNTNSSQSSFVTTLTWTAGADEDSALIPIGGSCSLSFIRGGSDVVEVYQVPDAVTAASAGTIVTTLSATTTIPFVVQPAQAGLKAVATTATAGGSILTVRCSNTQVSSSNQTDVLIGGVSGVSDVADPNDIDGDQVFTDEIICTRTNADCFYLSTTTGWWSATSTNTTDDTDWSPMTLEMIARRMIEGDGTYNVAAYSATDCIDIWGIAEESRNTVVCTTEEGKWNFGRPLTVVEVRTIPVINGAGSVTQNGTDGCDFKLVVGDALTTDVTSGEWNVPETNVAISIGDVFVHPLSTLYDLAIGENISIKVKDGSFCDNGSSCVCSGAWGYTWVEIWGLWQ